jgi:hypothetical protein
MSHRDSLIKKNKELSKPMDLMNVGFVGAAGGGVSIIDATWTNATPTTSGDYKIITYTSTSGGTFVINSGYNEVQYLVIGGGGSGGNNSGGGGAGGFRTGTLNLGAGTYNIAVGTGGAGSFWNGTPNDGVDSSFHTITASKGGAGGGTVANGAGEYGTYTHYMYPNAGGSSGGWSDPTKPSNINPTGNLGGYTPSEGNNGAISVGDGSGGGGGAGGNGAAGAVGNGGDGGIGKANPISGSTHGVSSGGSYYLAGGGGGGAVTGSSPSSSGGLGGGGFGTKQDTGVAGHGVVNTGSGGGGGQGGGGTSGNGGSGVVILRYQFQ